MNQRCSHNNTGEAIGNHKIIIICDTGASNFITLVGSLALADNLG